MLIVRSDLMDLRVNAAVLAISSSYRIDAVDTMTMTPATPDTMRILYRHRHRHPLTGGRGGAPQAEKEKASKKAEKKIFNAVNNAVMI
jgi:hypothetical protein